VRVFVLRGYIWRASIVIMSRLNRRLTTNIEEPVPVAVTRAKRFYPKPQSKATPVVRPSTAPKGIFYQQEVAAYRLPRSLWQASATGPGVPIRRASKQEHADGRQAAVTLDTAIRGTHGFLQKAFYQLQIANNEIERLKDESSERYEGFVEGMGANDEISYPDWADLILNQNGIMDKLEGFDVQLQTLNVFMSDHGGDEWSSKQAGYINRQADLVEDGRTISALHALKNKQAEAVRFAIQANQLKTTIKASQDEDREAEAEQNLREQELEDLVKKQQKELSALIDRHRNDAHEKIKEQIAKRDEIANDSLKISQDVQKQVHEARKEVALDVTRYANTILNNDSAESQE